MKALKHYLKYIFSFKNSNFCNLLYRFIENGKVHCQNKIRN